MRQTTMTEHIPDGWHAWEKIPLGGGRMFWRSRQKAVPGAAVSVYNHSRSERMIILAECDMRLCECLSVEDARLLVERWERRKV